MGFKTFGFAGGGEDVHEPEQVNWGNEDEWLGDARYSGERDPVEPVGCGPDGPDLRQPGGPTASQRTGRRA